MQTMKKTGAARQLHPEKQPKARRFDIE